MFTETQKLHLIEEVLRTNDESILTEMEKLLSKAEKKQKTKSLSAHDLAGVWSKKDAALIEKAIEEGCEQINMDDWK